MHKNLLNEKKKRKKKRNYIFYEKFRQIKISIKLKSK